MEKIKNVYGFNAKEATTGRETPLSDFAGQVMLIVNTASKCKYTRQFDGLQQLFGRYRSRGFVVLGFPSANFNRQEFGLSSQTVEFCRKNYGVEFPMFEIGDVAGPNRSPLFAYLSSAPWNGGAGVPPLWNFQKYLIDRNGRVADFFFPFTPPCSPRLTQKVEKLLDNKPA